MCDGPGCDCDHDDNCASCRRAKMRAKKVSKNLAETSEQILEVLKAKSQKDKHYSVPGYAAGGAAVGAFAGGATASLLDESRRFDRWSRQQDLQDRPRAGDPLRARGRGVTTMDPRGLRAPFLVPRSDGALSQDRRVVPSRTNLVGEVTSSRSRTLPRAPYVLRRAASSAAPATRLLSRNRYTAAGAALGGAYTGAVYGLSAHMANKKTKQRKERAARSKG